MVDECDHFWLPAGMSGIPKPHVFEVYCARCLEVRNL